MLRRDSAGRHSHPELVEGTCRWEHAEGHGSTGSPRRRSCSLERSHTGRVEVQK